MAPMLLVTLLLVPAAATASPQRESVVQRADVAPSRSAETSTRTEPGVTEANAGSGPGFDRPAETSIGPPPYGTLAVLAGLALLPFALMAVTSFAKISIVLSLLRNALGTPQAPSDPVIAGIALALTVFVMGPVFGECVNRLGAVDTTSAASTLAGATRAAEPVLAFLKRNARAEEVALFVELSSAHGHAPAGADSYTVLVPAFVTTELRQAFLTGFVIFLPFLVVDMIVANILMSMGMVMVSPSSVALPFKLMLFVLIDGWPLLLKGLALSYN